VEQAFPERGSAAGEPRWRIPFAHHPPFSAGPRHHNTREMARMLPLFRRAGVRVMFAGHEHNFQHSRTPGFDHFVTGAGGKVRRARPDRFESAHTESWATDCHFLLARIEGSRMTVRAIGGIDDPADIATDIERFDPDGNPIKGPIEIVSAERAEDNSTGSR
jgi:hypothetical protein